MDTKSNKFKLDFMLIGQDIKQAREAKEVTREQLSEIIEIGRASCRERV